MNPTGDTQAIHDLLQRYAQALNDSDTEAVMKLYTEDGVFMPQNFPSSVGAAAVRAAYDGVFSAIKLSVTFTVQEVEVTSPEWAFARTNSAGHTLNHASDVTSSEANQELFVLRKIQGAWKIARYCFATTNPPAGHQV